MENLFDKPVKRRGTGSLKWDVAENELPMWVADMDFETAPPVKEAILKRAEHGVFGYTDITPEWYSAMPSVMMRARLCPRMDSITRCTSFPAVKPGPIPITSGDRKSTRLNSSHAT